MPAAHSTDAPPAQKAPAEQAWHAAAPAPEKVPSVQGTQAVVEDAFAPLPAVPAGQGVQPDDAEALVYVPAEQVAPLPAALMHAIEPEPPVKKLAGQAPHVAGEEAPGTELKVLMGHGTGTPDIGGQ